MEWLTKMNEALAYIEENLEGTVDHRRAAQIACCSLTRFQRMFTFLTDVTVGEYVRCRRMTLAARELRDTEIKIIDLAAKYGYDSPEAFTRAFRAFHGIAPTAARKGGCIREYPPLSLEITVREGSTMLGEKPLVRMEELSGRRVVVFTVNCPEPETRAWNLMREWAVRNLRDYEARRYIGYAPGGHHPDGPEETAHAYCAMMILHGDEGNEENFFGARVADAPPGRVPGGRRGAERIF